MAIRAKYLLQVHPLVISEDLPSLPMVMRTDFESLFKPILQSSPDTGGILSCHKLKQQFQIQKVANNTSNSKFKK